MKDARKKMINFAVILQCQGSKPIFQPFYTHQNSAAFFLCIPIDITIPMKPTINNVSASSCLSKGISCHALNIPGTATRARISVMNVKAWEFVKKRCKNGVKVGFFWKIEKDNMQQW